MININIVSNEGHTEIACKSAEEALSEILSAADNNKKWVYLDAIAVDVNNLTTKMIESAQDITLTNPLIGG